MPLQIKWWLANVILHYIRGLSGIREASELEDDCSGGAYYKVGKFKSLHLNELDYNKPLNVERF